MAIHIDIDISIKSAQNRYRSILIRQCFPIYRFIKISAQPIPNLGGCYKDDYSDVVIIAIDSAPSDTKPAFDWRPTQKKIARWFLNVLPN